MKPLLKFILLLAIIPVAGAQTPYRLNTGQHGIQAPAALIATWGTPAQCRAHKAGIKDDMSLLPYVISAQWMQRGILYCNLTWLATHGNQQTVHTSAHALCGEDTVRDYRIFFNLENGILRMRWSRDFLTKKLHRCQ